MFAGLNSPSNDIYLLLNLHSEMVVVEMSLLTKEILIPKIQASLAGQRAISPSDCMLA